jgi:hypothetical protein
MIGNSPIQYTSRTYTTILNDINSDPELADKPEWFKRIIAGVGDMLSMINNGTANNFFLRTCFTREALQELCYLIDYDIPQNTTSFGKVVFHLDVNKIVFPFNATREELIVASKSNNLQFETKDGYTYTSPDEMQCDNSLIANNAFVTPRECFTGEKVRLSLTIPEGLAAGTDYYVIAIDKTHVRLAKSTDDCRRGRFIPIVATDNSCAMTFYSFMVNMYQQVSKNNIIIGKSTGNTPWQEYPLPDYDVLKNSITILVDDILWEPVDSLVFSNRLDTHYQIVSLSNNSYLIRFGDGEYGMIPHNTNIVASYAVGGGKKSNIPGIGVLSNYIGGNEMIAGTFNAEKMNGGNDQQNNEVVKKLAPGTLKTKDRFITVDDGETLALQYGGISQARCLRNYYGPFTVKVMCIAIGGGNINEEVQHDLADYFIDRTIMESVQVYVEDANVIPIDVACTIKMFTGYSFSSALPYIRFAWKLFLTETGIEIWDDYVSGGIEEAIKTINVNLNESFEDRDFIYIQRIIEYAKRNEFRTFGDRLDHSDIVSLIQANIAGIDFITITSPELPMQLAEDSITTVGNISLEEL